MQTRTHTSPDTSPHTSPDTALEDAPRPRRVFVARHALLVRLTHWMNAIVLAVMLLSGLQIFNAHPALYWGQYGADDDHAVIEIGAERHDGALRGVTRIGPLSLTTTGVLGVSRQDGETRARAFPSWLTVPSYQDLSTGRRWHFFFAWLLVINGLIYLGYGFWSGHLRRDIVPARAEVSPAHLAHEISQHARLRFPEGEAARNYNSLQKLAYLGVIAILLPLMVLTGLAMSPGFDAAVPLLPQLFGGRQSARTVHFIAASLLVGFVVVHIAMVLLSGVVNNLRSMITGRYAIDTTADPVAVPNGDKP